MPLSYQLHERQLLFYRRLLLSDNIVLRTLAGLPRVRFEMLGIAAKYDIDDFHYSTETVKNAVWLSFVNNIRNITYVIVFYCFYVVIDVFCVIVLH